MKESRSRILRETGEQAELGKNLCKCGEHSRRQGDLRAAQSSFAAAERIAQMVQASPESELGREISKLRESLSGEAGA